VRSLRHAFSSDTAFSSKLITCPCPCPSSVIASATLQVKCVTSKSNTPGSHLNFNMGCGPSSTESVSLPVRASSDLELTQHDQTIKSKISYVKVTPNASNIDLTQHSVHQRLPEIGYTSIVYIYITFM
jgi:hypothetical protein